MVKFNVFTSTDFILVNDIIKAVKTINFAV